MTARLAFWSVAALPLTPPANTYGQVGVLGGDLANSPTKRPLLQLVGAAEVVGGRLRLTPSMAQLAGAAWFSEKRYLAGGFEAVFRFQITEPGGLGPGADGFAFVLQNEGPFALAGRGSAGGFALGDGVRNPKSPGIPRSVAVFFDTFRNPDGFDPSDNYVAICSNGDVPKMRWPPRRLGTGRKLGARMKDGQVHEARIVYEPPVMSVYLDSGAAGAVPALSAPVDLGSVLDKDGRAYVGFTASTGFGFENHDILDWQFDGGLPSVHSDIGVVQSRITYLPENCLEGRNLCTPREGLVQERDGGVYHIILPAHREWGISIPNPESRAVTIANARGGVCLKLKNMEPCGGPGGFGAELNAGERAALLAPERNAGELIVKTLEGRTFFSVNGPKGKAFASGQGYFEFDVTWK